MDIDCMHSVRECRGCEEGSLSNYKDCVANNIIAEKKYMKACEFNGAHTIGIGRY